MLRVGERYKTKRIDYHMLQVPRFFYSREACWRIDITCVRCEFKAVQKNDYTCL